MGSFKIDLKRSFEKDLNKLDSKLIPRIIDAIENLSENPFSEQTKKLKGVESTYRLRIGDYRVIYQVELLNKKVIVYYVRHRKEVYKK
jgi:mRNA interferase RelE/StbE